MENTLMLWKTGIISDFARSKSREKVFEPEMASLNPVLENIRSEAGTDFVQYLQFLQIEKDQNMMALSSTHHYYYDFDDLKSIKTLVNLKKLNNIKSIGSFFQTVVRILPQEAIFIGYFRNDTGNRSVFSFYQTTRLFSGIVNYLDSKTDRSLTKDDVSGLLKKHRLQVIDITDINGMTYFCSRNYSHLQEITVPLVQGSS